MSRALQKLVYVGCRELGLDDDTRRDLQLQVTGKPSLKLMSDPELEQVVDALKARGFRPAARGSVSRPRRAPAARGDVRFCHVMWRLLAESGAVKTPGPEGLNLFIRRRFERKWGHVPIDIDAMCEWSEISDVIDALKAWCAREGIDLS